MRALKWIVERVNGQAKGVESPLGLMPQYEDIYWSGLDFSKKQFEDLMNIDAELWKNEIQLHQELFVSLQDKLPKELNSICESLLSKISITKK
jgi:phosphoenolpyruvate carboxykinase (GTP)